VEWISPAFLPSPIVTSRSAPGYGSGRSNTLSITVNMAVFAPIPSASVNTAAKANSREFAKLPDREHEVLKHRHGKDGTLAIKEKTHLEEPGSLHSRHA